MASDLGFRSDCGQSGSYVFLNSCDVVDQRGISVKTVIHPEQQDQPFLPSS